MRTVVVTTFVLAATMTGCGEESYCDRVDCDDAAATSSSTSSGSTGTEASSTTTDGPGGNGGSNEGGGGGGQGGSGTGGAGPFEVTPGDPKVGILRALDFEATVDVEWSVAEADGGSIDEDGLYLSPEEPGVFHVVATATDSGDEIEVEVTVAPLGLEVAGGIPGGAGNLDGIPARARFNAPRGFAVLDGPGDNYLIADTDNHTLRIYREEDGEVTTLAGLPGVAGFVNGIGAAARFESPAGIAMVGDTAYVVDGEGTCVRAVDSATGDVTRLAGACGTPGYVNATSGSASRFLAIQAIIASPDGDGLYVCDPPDSGATNKLRRLDTSTGETTESTLEGVPIGEPCFLASAPGDRTYLQSGLDSSIRSNIPDSITASPVVTIPGTDTRIDGLAFNSVGGDKLHAFDRERLGGPGTPYVTTLHTFDIGGSSFTEIAGGSMDYVDGSLASARFLTPGFLAADGNQLYFGEQEAHTVRRIDFDGGDLVETLLGARANVYPVDGSGTTARLLSPSSIALGEGDGEAYVAGSYFDRVIRRIDMATGAIDTFSGVRESYVIGSEPAFDTPVDGEANEAVFGVIIDVVRVGDSLYVADGSSTIRRVSLENGAVDTIAGIIGDAGPDDGFGAAARFDFGASLSGGLATDGVDLYVADAGNHAIRKLDLATDEVTTIAGGTEGNANGEGLAAQFITPAGLAYDRGVLYIADAEDHAIRAMDLASGEVSTLAGNHGLPGLVDGGVAQARFSAPFRIASDGIGNLYVSSLGVNGVVPHTIRRVRIDDVQTSTFAGSSSLYGFGDGPLTAATVGCPLGLLVDSLGDLLFADFCDGAIGAIRSL